MNGTRHDPEEQWIDVPEGEKPWGRTVRTWVDDNGKRHVQTNVPRPEAGPFVPAHGGAVAVPAPNIVAPAQDHDCTPWTERTDRRLAALEDAVNRLADTLQYLLARTDGGK